MKNFFRYAFFKIFPPFLLVLIARLETGSISLCVSSQLLTLIIILKMYKEKGIRNQLLEVLEDAILPLALVIFSIIVFGDKIPISPQIYNSLVPLVFYSFVALLAFINKSIIDDARQAMSKIQFYSFIAAFFAMFYIVYIPGFPKMLNIPILLILGLTLLYWAATIIAPYKNKQIDLQRSKQIKQPKKIS